MRFCREWGPLLSCASVLSRTPLMPVVGLDSQEEYTARAAVASLLCLVADELGSLAFKVDLYT